MDIKEIRRQNLEALVRKEGSLRACADKASMSQSQLSQVRTGYRNMGHSLARRLENAFGLPKYKMDQPLAFESAGYQIAEPRPHYGDTNVEPAHDNVGARRAPVVSYVEAGLWGPAVDIHPVGCADEMELAPVGASDESFWMRVKGDSMTNPDPSGLSVPAGFLIHVEPNQAWGITDLVVAKLDDSEEATFKMLVEDAGQKYLKPLNPTYPMIKINGNCRIIGKVTEIKRKL